MMKTIAEPIQLFATNVASCREIIDNCDEDMKKYGSFRIFAVKKVMNP